MAFKLKSPNFSSPCRSTTPLHQNVSTNEAYSVDASGNLVKTVTNRTADRIIKGTPAPDPVITKKPGSRRTFDPKGVTYADDCKGIKSGPGRTGTFNCDPKPPIDVPPTETIVEGEGTPDRIIPGTEEVIVTNTQRPQLLEPPSMGSKSNIEGSNYGGSGLGNIDLSGIDLGIEAPEWMKNLNVPRLIRNLLPCKGGGCPKY
jgi:hypothetical protein